MNDTFNMILLVDCNNFFASCEQLLNPELKNKPICVLSNNDGCVVARSNEAKDLGVPMGMPYFMAKKKFKKVTFLKGRRGEYKKISDKIMGKLKTYTPSVEIYSIDEAFLDVTGTEKMHKMNPYELGGKIRREIKEEIGIEVSIGVAKTKTLAKIGSEIAKSNTRRKIKTEIEGVFEINDKNYEEILLKTPIGEVWGVGKNLLKFFRKHNISNAKMYANAEDDFLKRNLGKKGCDLKKELLGVVAYPVIDYYTPPKSISRTSSFKEFSQDKDFIKSELNGHLHEVCIQLRKHNLAANSMYVMLRYKDFRTISQKINFKTPKSSEFELYKEMHGIFENLYAAGAIYRSSGICLYRLCPTKETQLTIFEDGDAKKKRKLSFAWDKIEQKFGYGAVNIGFKENKEEEISLGAISGPHTEPDQEE